MLAEKTIAQLEEAASGCSAHNAQNDHPEEETTDAMLAQWWLDFGINRKITKRMVCFNGSYLIPRTLGFKD